MDLPNGYCAHLQHLGFDLDTSVLRSVQASYVPKGHPDIFNIRDRDVDPALRRFLSDAHVAIAHAEIFFTPANGGIPIHLDDHGYSDNVKLNFVYGAPTSTMSWWDVRDASKPWNILRTPIGTPYVLFNEADCVKVFSAPLAGPNLVNVGVLHSVENVSSEDRWCVSYVLCDDTTSHRLRWPDAVGRFSGQIGA